MSQYKGAVCKWIEQLASRESLASEVYLVQIGNGKNLQGVLVFDLDYDSSFINQLLSQHQGLLDTIVDDALSSLDVIDTREELRYHLGLSTVKILSELSDSERLFREQYFIAINDLALSFQSSIFDSLSKEDRDGLEDAFQDSVLFSNDVHWQTSYVELMKQIFKLPVASKDVGVTLIDVMISELAFRFNSNNGGECKKIKYSILPERRHLFEKFKCFA